MSEGLSFGAYRAVRKVGQGGMGAVYLGEHTLIGRRAAIKVLHRDRSSQRESIERFFTEARATSAVEDPGIVQIYDFGVTTNGTAYLVMEYLDGESLSARLRRLRLLAPVDAVRITRQLAGSLAAAHAHGIVHRDLKPENLMMVRDGETTSGERPKILDFGIAKLGDDARDRFKTGTGAVMGTPAYMSPEQCNDTGKIDQRTDVYSLGCVLFHLLTGRPPFDVDGVGATIAAHLKEPAPRPSDVARHVPAAIDPLLARCLAKRPEDRFSSMGELQEACDAVLAQLPTEEAATVPYSHPSIAVREDSPTTLRTSVGESALDARPRPVGVWVAISAVAVVAGVILAVMTTGGNSPAGDESTTIAPAVIPPTTPMRDVLTGPASAAASTAPIPPPPPSEAPPSEPAVDAAIEPAIELPVEPAKTVEKVAPKTKTKPARKKKPKSTGSLYDEWD